MALPTPGAADPRSASTAQQSLKLYLTETAPAPVEKRSLGRWLALALLAILIHVAALQFMPSLFRPAPPPPVEVDRIDPAKLNAIKQQWKSRKFLLAKDPSETNPDSAAPKNARYESDRNRSVERETQGRKQNVIPNTSGDPNAKSQSPKKPAPKKIPLSNLSNFQGLPRPGPRPEEREPRRGRPGETADQSIDDPNLPVGAETMLNTVESVYYSFYARLFEQLGPLWQSNARDAAYRRTYAPGEYRTLAEIILDSEGSYVETIIRESSGEPELDGTIHRAWTRVPRYPNPPRGLIKSDGKIHLLIGFTFTIDNQRNWQYVPPERIE